MIAAHVRPVALRHAFRSGRLDNRASFRLIATTMRLLRALLAALSSALTLPALALPGGTAIVTTEQVRAELVAHAPEGVAAGKPLWLGLAITRHLAILMGGDPGIGKSTSSGSQLVSRIAMTGMPSLTASATAIL